MPLLAVKIIAIVLFVATYVLLLIFSKRRAFIALGSAVLFIILGVIPTTDTGAGIMPITALPGTVNWNLLLMLAGIMGLVVLFIESKMPAALGDAIARRVPSLRWAFLLLALLAGVISAFIDNVATVLIIAPIAIDICKKTGKSPVAPVIAIAIMSNLQGAATLVGDTTSILLGAEAGMNFFDFFVYQGRMGMFFVVQIAMILAMVFLFFVFRKDKKEFIKPEPSKPEFIFPSVLLILTIALLIGASFLPEGYDAGGYVNGIICMTVFAVGLAVWAVKTKDKRRVLKIAKEIDWMTLLLIASLFVIIGGISGAGIIADIAGFFTLISDNPFVIYTVVVFASVLLSAFIDNIPYVAAMLPVMATVAGAIGLPDPTLLYFGLLCGATLGGNLTPIGASANITALGILRKEGETVKFKAFMKISAPFTLIAVLTGYALIWFIWS